MRWIFYSRVWPNYRSWFILLKTSHLLGPQSPLNIVRCWWKFSVWFILTSWICSAIWWGWISIFHLESGQDQFWKQSKNFRILRLRFFANLQILDFMNRLFYWVWIHHENVSDSFRMNSMFHLIYISFFYSRFPE